MIVSFILAYFIGVFSVLLFQAFLLYKWWCSKERENPRLVPQRAKSVNPKLIADYLRDNSATENETCMFLNLILAFVWREWRDTKAMKNFFMKKMNSEFQDLLQSRTAGKVIEQITVQDFFLGTSLPVIKGVTIMKVGSKDPEEVPAELDLALDLEYTGGCHMAIQVDLLFGKSVYLAVKLAYLKGRTRLQFSRHPCTHWSLSFYEKAEVEFEAESQFDGKTIPQLSSLIINHLQKLLYRKHTLPNYKIRYQPFFPVLAPYDETQEVYIHNSLVTVGILEVEILGCSRLPEFDDIYFLYCTVSIDSLPWSQLAENSRALWPTFELEILREASDSSFGLTLSKDTDKKDFCKTIFIETIIPNSPASVAGFQKGDVFVAVNGQKVESLKHAAKLIKGKNRFTATIQRHPKRSSGAVDSTDAPADKLESLHPNVKFKNVTVDSDDSDSDEEFVNIVVPLIEKHAGVDSVKSVKELLTRSIELKQQRSGKRGRGFTFSGGKSTSPLTESDRNDKNNILRRSKTLDSKYAESPIKSEGEIKTTTQGPEQKNEEISVIDGDRDISFSRARGMRTSDLTDHPGNKKTKEVLFCQDPVWNEIIKFEIKNTDKYVNLCLWGRFHDKNEKDLLIGYITVSLMDIAMQCVSTASRKHEQNFVLTSLHTDRVISSRPSLRTHQGLVEELCGGDVSLIFCHSPSTVGCDESVIAKQRDIEKLAQQANSEDQEMEESLEPQEHDFMLTQFYFPTRCNYCNKKIWTKVACQCRNCAMICHKKCVEACRIYTNCMLGSSSKNHWYKRNAGRAKSEDDQEKDEDQVQDPGNSKETAMTTGEHAPETSATVTVQSNTDEDTVSEDKKKETSEDVGVQGPVSSSSETEMEREISAETAAEDMLTACVRVKEIGKELFSNLAPEHRKEKLQDMMARLQTEIDEENETRLDLYESLKDAKEEKQKAALNSLLAKSEERHQALAMLMLQYCAGLQSCTEAEELETYQL